MGIRNPGCTKEMIRFTCQHCNKTYKVPLAHAGRRAACLNCHKTITVPYPKTEAMPITAGDTMLYYHFDRLIKELDEAC